MLIERSERSGEQRKERNGREKREREKVYVCGREKKRGKIRWRGKENEREYSSLEWGLCEEYEGWCKGDGEAAVRRTERARR